MADSFLRGPEVRQILADSGVIATDKQWRQLQNWVARLLVTNEQINLISRKQADSIWEQQILHSLAPLACLDLPPQMEICDFGTGGGLPGISWAILRPHWQIVLLDARQKKIRAIEEMIQGLGITNVTLVAGRGEELGKSALWRHRFQWFSARAVSALENLECWTRNLRQSPSTLLAFKGGNLQEEPTPPEKLTNVLIYQEQPLRLVGYEGFVQEQKKIVTVQFR